MRSSIHALLAGLGSVALLAASAGCSNTSGQAVSNAQSQLMMQTGSQPKPINKICPVYATKKVDPKVNPLRYKGRLIGFSSVHAKAIWKTWPTFRRDAFVNHQLALLNGRPTNVIAAGQPWESQPLPPTPPETHVKDPTVSGNGR